MIKIICYGKIKEKYLKDGIEDYLKRINRYYKCEIIELKDDLDIQREEKEILKYIDKKNYNIALDIDGMLSTSENLATIIDKKFINYPNIVFMIGSSNGLSDNVKMKVNEKISFGKITMPHGLFRLVLVEQIYRACKINNRETYHK